MPCQGPSLAGAPAKSGCPTCSVVVTRTAWKIVPFEGGGCTPVFTARTPAWCVLLVSQTQHGVSAQREGGWEATSDMGPMGQLD